MASQKLENILNLSLALSEEERARSQVLNIGFDEKEKTWELIVKFHGEISRLEQEGIGIEVLLAGYAIVTLPENRISFLTEQPEIEYVEMPKELTYSVYFAKQQSCFPEVEEAVLYANDSYRTGNSGFSAEMTGEYLTGRGCLMAVFDSGIDYTLSDFRDLNGESRILYLWDQSLTPQPENGLEPPQGFSLGVEFTKEQIDAVLLENSENPEAMREQAEEGRRRIPSSDVTGHGTAVAAIAAGSNPNRLYTGAAPGASLLIVKLGSAGNSAWPRTTQLMRAFTYALRKAQEWDMPLVINLSFGNSYGAHDGTSLLERFIDDASEVWKTVICVGSGNEGAAAGHTAGRLVQRGSRTQTGGLLRNGNDGISTDAEQVDLTVGPFQTAFSVQLWKNYADRFRVILQSPSGERFAVSLEKSRRASAPENGAGKNGKGIQVTRWEIERTQIIISVGEPRPYTVNQEIYFDFLPTETYVSSGIWTFWLEPLVIRAGEYQMYLPGETVRSADTRFTNPTPDLTLTIPSTARGVITVGAVNGNLESYADFSGRGVSGEDRVAGFLNTKPDLAAPGVGVTAARAGGGYASYTGTSFAAPLVSGAAALLMEWGIVRGNDPYLYGEKVKAYLRRGAEMVRGGGEIPGARVGYGRLCVQKSLPGQEND